MAERLPAASETPGWFVVKWLPIWERTRLAPQNVPGVTTVKGKPSTGKDAVFEIHETHLAMLGFERPKIPHTIVRTGDVTLRPHQVETIDYIRSRRGTLLASEMRTGKTASVMYAHEPERGPLFVFGPLAARGVWHEWAARRFGACVAMYAEKGCKICERVGAVHWDDRPSFMSVEGLTYDAEPILAARPHVMFATYAVARAWKELAMALFASADISRLGTLALDEAHLSGAGNRKSITHASIAWLNTIAHRTVIMSGTPKPNKPSGLWALLNLALPAAFGSFWDCAVRYFDAKPTEYGWSADGLTNEDELNLRLEACMIRHTWREISADLPPIERALETVALTQQQKDQVENLAAKLRLAAGNAKTVVGIMARVRRLFAEAKVPHALKLIHDTVVRDGYSMVVWTWHKDVAEKLTQELFADGVTVYGPIHGSIPAKDRETILEEVRNDQRPRVLVATMASLGVAVSTSWASHEVFVELDWSPHNIAQAEMRPFDGTKPISCTYLVADCDIDEGLAQALVAKLADENTLKLKAGVGDVSEILGASFGVEQQSMDVLAELLMTNAEGEV